MLFQIQETNTHLLGSVHLLPPGVMNELPSSWCDAFNNANRLIVESRPAPWPPCLPEGRLASTAPADLYRQATAFADAIGYPRDVLANHSPAQAALALSFTLVGRTELRFEFGVDQLVTKRADEQNKLVDCLETAEDFSEAIYALPIDEQCSILRRFITQPERALERIRAVIRAWGLGDQAALTRIAEQTRSESEAFFHAIYTQRNAKWMPKIRQTLLKTESSLITVGALHLVGEGSIIDRLKGDGLSIVLKR
jgi:uncharacterized protein YbaP (TraB family)